jgi:hypothetical protein
MSQVRQFLVTVKTKEPVLVIEALDYIQEAVETWGGQRHPDDPFFPSNLEEVIVQRIIKNPSRV